eukprot:3425300-Karenia_brevis.AAC.1
MVPEEELRNLDAKDNVLRKMARRAGRSHHIAVIPAVASSGRVIGRVLWPTIPYLRGLHYRKSARPFCALF